MIRFFTAPWCTACNNLKNSLEEGDLEDIEIIDVDNEPSAPTKYDVRSIPCIIKYDEDGYETERAYGTMSRNQFLSFVK